MNNPNFFQLQNKMRLLFNIAAIFNSEKGVTAVYVALLIPIFLGFAALAIDVGFIMVTRNELKNAADAAALAGTIALIAGTPTPELAAQTVASHNKVSGEYITTDKVTVTLKKWYSSAIDNAVEVKVIAKGPITTFFAIPKNTNIYSATATAAIVSPEPLPSPTPRPGLVQ